MALCTLASDLVSEKNALRTNSAFMWLVQIWVEMSGPTILRYTSNVRDVTFRGETWTKKNMKISPLRVDGHGSIGAWKFKIDNTDRVLAAHLENGYLRDMPVLVYMVNSNYLSDSSNNRPVRTKITKAVMNAEEVVLYTGFYDIRKVQVPRIKYQRFFCVNPFKGRRCQYTGAETTCTKLYARCVELANTANMLIFRTMSRIAR